MSKNKLLQAVAISAKNDFIRQFRTSSSKMARREVISADAFENVEYVITHTGQVRTATFVGRFVKMLVITSFFYFVPRNLKLVTNEGFALMVIEDT